MKHRTGVAILLAAAALCRWAGAEEPASRPASQPAGGAVCVVVFDFHTEGAKDAGTSATPLSQRPIGVQIADSVRLRLARHKEYRVIDRLTTQDLSGPLPLETDLEKIRKPAEQAGATVVLCGAVRADGRSVQAQVRCMDLAPGAKPIRWQKTFSDATERARGVIAMAVVESLRGSPEWVPPQYGDEAEPKNFGAPLNANGDFDGAGGWEKPDNVSTFIVDGPAGRGKVLRIRTDLARDPWLAYKRALRLGQADPARPPQIARDTSYGSVAGLEGVHFCGEMIPATPGRRYWLVADHCGGGGAKVFVKGFRRTDNALDGLPESSLAEMGLTPEQFADLTEARRRDLIAADARKHPERYLRECYRWYLNCAESKGAWKHFAAPFPPRGGLPGDVEFLQVQVYSYWPPGVYLWDGIHVYKDPDQTAPLPEEKPRTPNRPARPGGAGDAAEK